MAEAIGVAASIVAVIQLADRVATVCTKYISTCRDYPKDLRSIYVEVSSVKAVFEGLQFLDANDPGDSALPPNPRRPGRADRSRR